MYHEWRKDDSWTPTIQEGLVLLKQTLNCSAVADFFNEVGFPTGPYCRKDKWDGQLVRLYYKNRLLAGHPGRGFKHTVKHNETGRRVSVKNTKSDPTFLDYPHLAHINSAEQDEVNRLLGEINANCGRKKENGNDPLWQKPKKRTKFPGQYARCWYCGHHCVWGGNGMTNNLMCSNSRNYQCWNSVGFNGQLAAQRIVAAITSELYKLENFDTQFSELVSTAHRHRSERSPDRWQNLLRDEKSTAEQMLNLTKALAAYGPQPHFENMLAELKQQEKALLQERRYLELQRGRELVLPQNIKELRQPLEEEFAQLAIDSPEFGTFLQQLVPGFHVYLVRLCDGGHLLPRARIALNLAGHVTDVEHVPELTEMLTKVITIDLFKLPPQREQILEDVVRLTAAKVKPKLPIDQQAIALDRMMQERGLATPYVFLTEPPDDYPKLRRYKNKKYHFKPLEGYKRPLL